MKCEIGLNSLHCYVRLIIFSDNNCVKFKQHLTLLKYIVVVSFIYGKYYHLLLVKKTTLLTRVLIAGMVK